MSYACYVIHTFGMHNITTHRTNCRYGQISIAFLKQEFIVSYLFLFHSEITFTQNFPPCLNLYAILSPLYLFLYVPFYIILCNRIFYFLYIRSFNPLFLIFNINMNIGIFNSFYKLFIWVFLIYT